MALRCPVCKAENTQGPTCRRCKADLSLVFALEDRRALALEEARFYLANGSCLREARGQAQIAHHLRQDEESKQLLALTALLCRDFHEALRLRQQLAAGDPNE